ncbi:NAD(P)-binding domain-containing protein [Bacillus cereus]|nr:NAD(P)-binding domain-containing protein [Bacillus cereus]
MQVGLIGLGKMGLNLGKNLMDHKHEVVAFDLNTSAVEEMKEYGATGTSSLSELVQSLQSPRILWVMVPHAVVDSVIDEVTPLLSKGDILIEAGNSHYKESIRPI